MTQNDWFSVENYSPLLCLLAAISLRIPWACERFAKGIEEGEKENMAAEFGPKIYIRHNGTEYYVGQSKNIVNRPAHHTGRLLALFDAPEDTHERRIIETEMIQFIDAAGVPLANIHQRKEPKV